MHRNTRPATAHDASEMYQKAVDWKRRSAARWVLPLLCPRRELQTPWLEDGALRPGRGLPRVCTLSAGINLLSDVRQLCLLVCSQHWAWYRLLSKGQQHAWEAGGAA